MHHELQTLFRLLPHSLWLLSFVILHPALFRWGLSCMLPFCMLAVTMAVRCFCCPVNDTQMYNANVPHTTHDWQVIRLDVSLLVLVKDCCPSNHWVSVTTLCIQCTAYQSPTAKKPNQLQKWFSDIKKISRWGVSWVILSSSVWSAKCAGQSVPYFGFSCLCDIKKSKTWVHYYYASRSSLM